MLLDNSKKRQWSMVVTRKEPTLGYLPEVSSSSSCSGSYDGSCSSSGVVGVIR